ncbi:hypothetical protein NP493_5194g00000 [Ridgeia piscesae]|uniref:Uncharacterized protein n=1 Tax=Ridgeia piscesae TaxID=27915 RepID=A0AAD9IWJ2_RIDPI|nr:hypothetical protein NP493_5194g00000 [Ridgeia piscesae]
MYNVYFISISYIYLPYVMLLYRHYMSQRQTKFQFIM